MAVMKNPQKEAFIACSFYINTVLQTRQNVHSQPKPKDPALRKGLTTFNKNSKNK